MGMNIKNDEAHRLAQEIAEATGETITATVLRALRDLKARELGIAPPGRPRTPEEKLAAWHAWQAFDKSRPPPKGMMSSEEADAFLYDERGLPK